MIREYELDPVQLGLEKGKLSDLQGGTPLENAAILRGILEGTPGPKRDVTVLNGAAAILVAGRAKNMGEALKLAQMAIDSGEAKRVLEHFIAFTRRCLPCS
jgi:anthranilate phosphoribosyltransferase